MCKRFRYVWVEISGLFSSSCSWISVGGSVEEVSVTTCSEVGADSVVLSIVSLLWLGPATVMSEILCGARSWSHPAMADFSRASWSRGWRVLAESLRLSSTSVGESGDGTVSIWFLFLWNSFWLMVEKRVVILPNMLRLPRSGLIKSMIPWLLRGTLICLGVVVGTVPKVVGWSCGSIRKIRNMDVRVWIESAMFGR